MDGVVERTDYLKILVGMDTLLVTDITILVLLATVLQFTLLAIANLALILATAQHVIKVAIAKHVHKKIVVLAVTGMDGALGLT